MSTLAPATTLGTTTTAPPSIDVTSVDQRSPLAELILAFASCVALILLAAAQMIIRGQIRKKRLSTMRRRTRMDAAYYMTLDKWQSDPRCGIVTKSIAVLDRPPPEAPQFHTRVIPSVVAVSCARREAKAMLDKARGAMPPVLSHASMRTIAAHVRAGLDPEELMRFVAIFEAVLFGVHRGDGSEGDVTEAELNFMRGYFTGHLAKELQL